MACFTASGAPSGAAACPKRSWARVPGTVGPDDGKMFAFADDRFAAKTAAPTRILRLRVYTTDFGACLMPQELALPRKKSTWPHFVKSLFSKPLAMWLRNNLCCINIVRRRMTKSVPQLDFREALSTL